MFFKNKNADLRSLVKEGNLANLKSIVEKGDASLTTDAASGMTMLHLAVEYNKLDLIDFLLTSEKIDKNAQDSSGTTPLLMAFREKRFEAAKLLMDADARLDISNAAGQTILTYIVQYGLVKRKIPEHVMRVFRLKLQEVDNDQTPQPVILTMYRSVSLKSVVTLKSAKFTRQALESRISISPAESRTLIVEAMYSSYLDNLRVLLTVGPDLRKRKKIFRKELRHLIEGSYPDLTLALTLVKQLIDWRLPGRILIRYFRKVFEKGEVKAIRMLMDSGIVEYAKGLLREDLTAHLFANKNRIVVQVLGDREFDANAMGAGGLSALHFAVQVYSKKNLQLLLDRDADVNVKDNFGMTPLFDAGSLEFFMPLIARGADVQVIDYEGYLAFEFGSALPIKRQNVLGHLAIVEAQGQPISQYILDLIRSKEDLQKRFDKYRSYVDRMKNYAICEQITMFSILTEEPKVIERYMRNKREACKKLITNVMPFRMELGLNNSYYAYRLEENIKLVMGMCKLKNRAMKIVARSVGLFEADHLVVAKIVEFLTYEDLCKMFK